MSETFEADGGTGAHWLTRVTGQQWLVMVVAGGGWMFDNLDQRLFSLARIPALVELMKAPDSNLAVQAFGKTVTAVFLIGWGLGGLVFGPLGDRRGPARILCLSILIYSLGTAATVMASSPNMFLVLRFVAGFGIGGVFGLAVSIITDNFAGRTRIYMLTLLQILSALGNIGAALLKMGVDNLAVNQVFAPALAWRLLFIVGGMPGLLAIVGLLRLQESAAWSSALAAGVYPPGFLGPMRTLLGNQWERRNLLIGSAVASAGVVGLWGVGEYAVDLQDAIFHSYFAAKGTGDIANLTAFAKNRAYFLQMIGATIGMLLFARAASRFGRRPAFITAFLLAFIITIFTYANMQTPADSLWMTPLMGMAQFSVFVGFSIYLPELFSPRVCATGVSFCYNIGRLAAAGGSFASAALSTGVFGHYPSPLPLRYSAITMSVIFLLGALAAYFGPETRPAE